MHRMVMMEFLRPLTTGCMYQQGQQSVFSAEGMRHDDIVVVHPVASGIGEWILFFVFFSSSSGGKKKSRTPTK